MRSRPSLEIIHDFYGNSWNLYLKTHTIFTLHTQQNMYFIYNYIQLIINVCSCLYFWPS